MSYRIRPASPEDIPALMGLRTEAENWLQAIGSDQWSDREMGQRAIVKWRQTITEGRSWVIIHPSDIVVGTVSRGPADSDFWQEDDQLHTALYLYKLIISRSVAGAGIGGLILDWACRVAALEGRRWVRLDCWRTATGLQQYYESAGFEHVRTEAPEHRRSGWLAQRKASLIMNAESLRVGEVDLPVQSH